MMTRYAVFVKSRQRMGSILSLNVRKYIPSGLISLLGFGVRWQCTLVRLPIYICSVLFFKGNLASGRRYAFGLERFGLFGNVVMQFSSRTRFFLQKKYWMISSPNCGVGL
ncbi:hypothetical protein ACS0TY_015072 [Phlomoides rotata]